MIDYVAEMTAMGRAAKTACRRLATATTAEKNAALAAIAAALRAQAPAILEANAKDLQEGKAKQLTPALMDRLELTPARLEDVAKAVESVIELPDPVGVVDREFTMPNGLAGTRVRVPIGAIGIIYESRPNVTVDAAVLCLKSGNAVLLRGGKEAIHSNRALAAAISAGLAASALPGDCVQLVPWTDRSALTTMLRLQEYVDLIIPRGGEGLIRFVAENATVPVIKHYKGVCHLYVDKAADPTMAERIALNAKCQRPGVCNAIETMLIHRDALASHGPQLAGALLAAGVELRGDEAFCAVVPEAIPATDADWGEEYLELILAVRTVADVQEAVDHVNTFGSGHSDAIVSDDPEAVEAFLAGVDSAAVYANASTRFTDGGQFGLGAEIGISTDRIHARGPMGLAEMTTYKYVIRGDGEIR